MTNNIAFIVTGMGRSGTKWLSMLLDHASGIRCYHEPIKEDVSNYYRVMTDIHYDGAKYCRWRLTQMVPPEGQKWGEVNSYLRYLTPHLRQVLGNAPIAGLVRNPMRTINSIFAREMYKHPGIPPLDAPKGIEEPFAKCCWYWADAYNRLITDGVPIVSLESLNANYDSFARFAATLGCVVPIEVWRNFAGHPVNQGVKTGSDLGWTTENWRTFDDIALPTALTLGYLPYDQQCD